MRRVGIIATAVLLSACQQTGEDAEFWSDLRHYADTLFEPKPRQGVRVVKGEAQPLAAQAVRSAPKSALSPKPKSTIIKTSKMVTKRINTTACNDADDWYLDGYRVGKSFPSQRKIMYQQRANYCKNNIPARFKTNWESGYQMGRTS